MAKLCEFTRHDDSEKPRWSGFVESDVDALEQALAEAWGVEANADPDVAKAELAKAIEAADAAFEANPKDLEKAYAVLRACDIGYGGFEPDEEEDYREFVVWRHRSVDGALNWGVGEGSSISDTDKRDNVWMTVGEWTPDPERKAELEAMSKEELIMKVLRLEAVL